MHVNDLKSTEIRFAKESFVKQQRLATKPVEFISYGQVYQHLDGFVLVLQTQLKS